jgi:hypothetical protein
MLMNFLALYILLAPPTADVFKKEKAPLESAVDALVTSTGAQLLQRSHAAYIEEYGIVVTLEAVFEQPQGIFGTPKPPAELRSLIAQRRASLQEKLTTFLKQRVATTDAIDSTAYLSIVVHILNANPAEVPNLPQQIVTTVKKDSPQQPSFREY